MVGVNQPQKTSGLANLNITAQKNPNKINRLEVFCIFSDPTSSPIRKIYKISEDDNAGWNSTGEVINFDLEPTDVYSAIDKKSRVNLFAIVPEVVNGKVLRTIYHTNLQNTQDLPICEKPIPS